MQHGDEFLIRQSAAAESDARQPANHLIAAMLQFLDAALILIRRQQDATRTRSSGGMGSYGKTMR